MRLARSRLTHSSGSARALLKPLALPFLISAILHNFLFPTTAPTAPLPEVISQNRSGILERYDPGIPASLWMEWDLPSGLGFGISGGHELHQPEHADPGTPSERKMNLFPLSFLMKVPLYETPRISQSMSFGIGPYFLHQGRAPILLQDMDITGMTTCLTEWVSRISENLHLNLSVKFTQAFQTMKDRIPGRSVSTWIGLMVRW